jgi:tetratricopeptide (TPR) repeat protein
MMKHKDISKLILLMMLSFLGGIVQVAADVLVSYDEQFHIDLSNFETEKGCDIWLTRDEGKTWELVGKTFKKESEYVYEARNSGLHQFHIHAHLDENDDFRPVRDSQVHASILLEKMEQGNPMILYSNNRSLSISYEVQDITQGLPGSNFESWLYYTKTSGLDWNLYGPDDDGVSPVAFTAQEDGLYGFKVISSDIAGQKEAAPGPGVVPDILVRIDTQAPQVECLSPQPFDLWESGTVREICWKSQDEAMERLSSVSLYYSIEEEGNWKLIADKVSSSGVIEWKVPESSNGKCFIQIRAQDLSGNRGVSPSRGPFFTRNILEEMLDPMVRAKADGYYDTATICRKNRDFPKAIKYYRMVFQLNPYHVKAYNDVGITLMHLGLVSEAFQNFEMGLKYSPSNPNLLSNLARLYGEHMQWKEAEKILERLVALYPKDPSGLWLMADVRFHQGRPDLAREYWKRITQLDFSDESRGPRYRVWSRQRLAETLIVAQAPQTAFWPFR